MKIQLGNLDPFLWTAVLLVAGVVIFFLSVVFMSMKF